MRDVKQRLLEKGRRRQFDVDAIGDRVRRGPKGVGKDARLPTGDGPRLQGLNLRSPE